MPYKVLEHIDRHKVPFGVTAEELIQAIHDNDNLQFEYLAKPFYTEDGSYIIANVWEEVDDDD